LFQKSFFNNRLKKIIDSCCNNNKKEITTTDIILAPSLNNTTLEQQQYDHSVPPEWYELDREVRIQLCYYLSWENLMKWEDFDIFMISKLCNGKPLLFVGWAILASPHSQYLMEKETMKNNNNKNKKGYNFLETYNISSKCMIDFLRGIEDRYRVDNPYHNNIHAADVLQSTHAFLVMGSADKRKRLLPSLLQLFSILVSAVIHDVGHPGYNNTFQSNSLSPTSLLYNDTSVLENHHISLAFRMILGTEGNSDWNIFKGMDPDDFVTCRKLITEAILHTDMALHFTKLDEIKKLPSQNNNDTTDECNNDDDDDNEDTAAYSWKVIKFLMHMADISNLAKRKSISIQWTDRVLTEFFRQGDKEKELGLPVSPLCDRNTTSPSKSQVGFIDSIVRPSLQVLQRHLPSITTIILPLLEINYKHWEEKELLSSKKTSKKRTITVAIGREKETSLEVDNNIVVSRAA